MARQPVWQLCLNPDWDNRARGLFVQNTGGNHDNRFWKHRATGEERSPSRPPAPRQAGAADAEQAAILIREGAPYTITEIMVDCSARGNGAGQASPFRDGGGNLVCTIFDAPTARGVQIGTDRYSQIGPFDVFVDPAFGNGHSRYELTIVARLEDNATNEVFEFSYYPEMDVDNDP